MKVHISFADPETEEWKICGTVAGNEQTEFGISLIKFSGDVLLPNSESLRLTGTYDPAHRGVSILLFVGSRQVAELGGFKTEAGGYDPSMSFLTPGGNYVQLLVGT